MADPRQIAATTQIYVAETDEQARREAEPHMMWYFRNGLKTPTYHLTPPGSMTVRSLEHILRARVLSRPARPRPQGLAPPSPGDGARRCLVALEKASDAKRSLDAAWPRPSRTPCDCSCSVVARDPPQGGFLARRSLENH
jgi:hypothetical protein